MTHRTWDDGIKVVGVSCMLCTALSLCLSRACARALSVSPSVCCSLCTFRVSGACPDGDELTAMLREGKQVVQSKGWYLGPSETVQIPGDKQSGTFFGQCVHNLAPLTPSHHVTRITNSVRWQGGGAV